MPPAGHALRAEVGGGIIFVTSGEVCWAAQKTASQVCDGFCDFDSCKLKMPASVGRQSLRSYNACMVYLGSRGILEKLQAKTR